jgi:rhodanese-related sulfurtransferase
MGLLDRFRRRSVSAADGVQRVADGAVLVDVRSAGEWRSGHAREAKHLPLDVLPGRMGELAKNRPVVAVCHSGIRSARAAKILTDAGYDAVSLRGGMGAWVGAGGSTTGAR